MNIKLAYYALSGYNEKYSPAAAIIGDKVCPANGCSSVGVIVEIKRAKDTWEGKQYTILWGTGKKRGTTSVNPGRNLVDLKKYLAAIKKETDKVESMMLEASTVGL